MIQKIWPVFSALENLLPYMYAIILSSVCCYKKLYLGLLWWSSGWESDCQCRGHRFNAWFRKIPLPKLQSNLAHVRQLPKPAWPRARALQRGATTIRSLLATTRESLHTVMKMLHSQIRKKQNKTMAMGANVKKLPSQTGIYFLTKRHSSLCMFVF